MSLVFVVMGLALLQFLYFGFLVGKARGQFGVKAPATTGNEGFERVFRVQMNTLETLIVFVPSLWIFASYVDARWAVGLGVLYLIGRFLYCFGYIKDPSKRSTGYLLSFGPTAILLFGGIIGAVRASLPG